MVCYNLGLLLVRVGTCMLDCSACSYLSFSPNEGRGKLILFNCFQMHFFSYQEYILNQDVKGNLTDNQFEKELYDQSLEVEP